MEWDQRASRPLAVEGAFNVRDLGGYPTASGKRTKQGVFLRSDSLHNLTEPERKPCWITALAA